VKAGVAAWNLYLTAIPVREQPGAAALAQRASEAAATIINGMEPRNIGRVLGIGVRVAGRIAGQRIAAPAQSAARAPQPHVVRAATPVAQSRVAGQAPSQVAAPAGRGVAQGVGGFLRPFRRVGGILWLEVTGVFFLLPVLVFAPTLWRASVEYPHTADHRTFWITALVVAVFLYLGISSFWRARRR
jgi:hypothetical protein